MSQHDLEKRRVEITYEVETMSPLHVGTGRGALGLHRAMLRDDHGVPYIPGSTIKGRARHSAMRICEWMGLPVLGDAAGSDAGGRTPNGPSAERDIPHRIFGSAWKRCTLRFSDARTAPSMIAERPDDPLRGDDERRFLRERAHGFREVRTGAARSRLLGTVSHRRLYQVEVAPPGLVLSGDVCGHLDCRGSSVDIERVEFLVLWLALLLMVEDGVGGSRSSGSGKLAWAKMEMRVEGDAFAPDEGDVAAVLGMLSSYEAAEG